MLTRDPRALVTVIFLLSIANIFALVTIFIVVRKVMPLLRRIACVLRVDEEDQLHEHLVDLEPGWRVESPAVRPLSEGYGYVDKGGHNEGPSQVTKRSTAPGPSRRVPEVRP
jgi:hypothetical protein